MKHIPVLLCFLSLHFLTGSLTTVCAAAGMELDTDILAEPSTSEELASTLLNEKVATDIPAIVDSYYCTLDGWDHVRRTQQKAASNEVYHWQGVANGGITPLDDGPAVALLAIPQEGSYRFNMRHAKGLKGKNPLVLTLTAQKSGPGGTTNYIDAGDPVSNVFGMVTLRSDQQGKSQELKLPVRFETETAILGNPAPDSPVWEYRDITLAKGVYRMELTAPLKRGNPQALFVSRSKNFRPSSAPALSDCTLNRIYVRFRVVPADDQPKGSCIVTAALLYHWRKGEDTWNWGIGTSTSTPVGSWTPFIEATEAIVGGPGPWSTLSLNTQGVTDGMIFLEFAWHPSPEAALCKVETALGNGRAMLRVPNGSWNNIARTGTPGWGVWNLTTLEGVSPQERQVARYLAMGSNALAKIGGTPEAPRLKHIRLSSGCGVGKSFVEPVSTMMVRLGINWIEAAPATVKAKYEMIDENSAYNVHNAAALAQKFTTPQRARMTKFKTGDEITTLSSPAFVNSSLSRRKAFHAYFTEQAAAAGLDMRAFLGVDDVTELACTLALPENPGRFDRRLAYYSHRFCHLVTCEGYAATVREIEKYFPNARVYNNYTPHPVFLTGATMNDGDWFVLTRNKAQTLGWAEDWATYGSWGLYTRHQCVSFYAALVECAARKHNYPSGFYVGVNCGGAAQKIFACVGRGLTWLHLYDWGPIDNWAEGSNAWSEEASQYDAVAVAARALAPADRILGEGRREPRRTAILYNRSHEIINGGEGRMNLDWLGTYMALNSSHIPVDIIIEEDLNPADLKRYASVWVGGYNLERRHLAALRDWVNDGGQLIGTANAIRKDVGGDAMREADELLGGRQLPWRQAATGAVAAITFEAYAKVPAGQAGAGGPRFSMQPAADATVIARYGNGEPAAVRRTAGKGETIAMGFLPGFVMRSNSQGKDSIRSWIAGLVINRLGPQRVIFDYPESEAVLFEHPELGTAVLITDYGRSFPKEGGTLSVKVDHAVKDVSSALYGPLKWRKEGDRIIVAITQLSSVDSILFH